MCDRAVKDVPRGNHTYQSNGNAAESGICSKNFVGLGCSVTIRGRDTSGRNCEIADDGLKQAYEDIKAIQLLVALSFYKCISDFPAPCAY